MSADAAAAAYILNKSKMQNTFMPPKTGVSTNELNANRFADPFGQFY